MRKLILIFMCLLCTCHASFGQEKEKELFLLRGMLSVPRDTSINLKASGSIPTNNPLKVFLTTNTEVKVRNSFLDWFRAWNEGEGLKYGLIEVVADFATADIALVRITDPVARPIEAHSTYQTSSEIDPATRKPVTEPRYSTATKFVVDVNSYIITRENGELKAVYRHADSAIIGSSFRSGAGMMEDLTRMQPQMIKAVNEGTINSKARKDSKLAGDRLRDEFFKLLKARAKQNKK